MPRAASGVKQISLVVERKRRQVEPAPEDKGADCDGDAERDIAAGEHSRAAPQRDDLGQQRQPAGGEQRHRDV
jgi:hypothetical protein